MHKVSKWWGRNSVVVVATVFALVMQGYIAAAKSV